MFRSELTGKLYPAGTKQRKVVVETRAKEYLNQYGEVIGRGYETVKELAIGPDETRNAYGETGNYEGALSGH